MAPAAARRRDRINNTGILWRTTSHFWSLIDVDIQIITKRVSLFNSAIPRTTQPTIQNHLRRHLASFTPTLLHGTLHNSTNPTLLTQLYSTQLYSTQLYSTQLYSTQLIIRYQSQVKPFHTPLEAGISVKMTVNALTAQSVQPQGLISRRSAFGTG